ncbi:hypothetical protein DL96DRAFT_1707169 [Flagelloscypha sp. PMI_526]|nr:hypothetical protein DL96DRAFT_1707169 [Flagelloscypha sp. PMI_526]
MDKIYEAYKHVIQASRRHNGNDEQGGGLHLDAVGPNWRHTTALISTIVASIQKPLSYIKPRSETLDRQSLHNAARLFAERPVLRDTELDVVRGLIAEDQYRPASALFSSISSEPESPHYMHTALALAARQGDSDAAQTHFEALHVRGLIGEADMNMLLYSYAVRGEAESVVELFNRMFPRLPDGGRRGNPSLAVHNVVLFAFAHRANLPAIERWMGEITAQGLQPDGELLSMWRASGWSPNRVTYTQIMTVYAARKQPETVERIFQRALDEGIQPDRRMFSAVLHAHVEAGSWKGVIRAFDFIRTSKKIVLTIDEYNLVLRAYLLMGSPFHLIAKLFSKLEDQQIPPNHITYQILVQSACESGRMGIATSIFAELVRLEEKEKHRALITPDLCTVVMGGFLLYGNQERARVVYDDMLDRGFQPRAVTYARILKAYASQKTASMMENVESFVNSLMNSPLEQRVWEKAVYGPSSSLGFVYAPVLHAYASQRRPESTIKFYQRYVSEGGQPDLGLLTEVLNAYRNSFSVDEALSLWLSIFQLGKDFSQNVTLFPGDPVNVSSRTARSDVLSIPFSIYLDILSTAGLHEEIASAWREYTAAGFTITSHNWNHLCVALVRAGQIRRAFDIVQKVILPYQKLSRETLSKRRTVNPKSPLSFEGVNDHEKEEKEDESEVMMVESSNNLLPADQDYKYHITQAPSEDPKNQYDRRRRVHKYGSIVKRLLQKDKLDHDFMHPLYLMHQLSPSWNTWRLHTTTKMVLLRVLESLRRGFMIQPNRPKMIRQDADIELGNQDIEAKSRAHDDTDKQPFSLRGMNVSDIEEKAPDAPVEKPERPVSPTDSPPSFTPEFEPPTRRTAEYKAPEYPDEPEEERLLAQQLLQELVQHTPDAMNLLSNFAGQQWKRRGPRLYLHLYRNPQRRPIFKTQQVWKSTPNSENRRWWG